MTARIRSVLAWGIVLEQAVEIIARLSVGENEHWGRYPVVLRLVWPAWLRAGRSLQHVVGVEPTEERSRATAGVLRGILSYLNQFMQR
jgi:hypothetical protein